MKIMKAFFVVAVAIVALCADADTWTDPGTGITWNYLKSNVGISLGGYPYFFSPAISSTTPRTVTIPSTLDGYLVWDICPYAFSHSSLLTSVTIPDSVTRIGHDAFYGCSSLTSISIPNSVTSIGDRAFNGCHIMSATLPGWDCKINLSSVTNIVISKGTTEIADSGFARCSSLASVMIPDSVTSIGDRAFYNCSSLTSVTIPNSVTSIGGAAFEGCSGLADSNGFVIVKGVLYDYFGEGGDVVIPNSVTSIGGSAFFDCDSLTSVTIPDSVMSIGSYAFFACSSLRNITMPNSVTNIGARAFSECSSLTSVTIPDSVTSIENWAFEGCGSLTSVTIPDSVTSIGERAFKDCSSLKEVHISDLAKWCNINFGDSYANPLCYADNLYLNGNKVTHLVIADGVTSIGDYAFNGCSSLTSVTIPNSVTSIGGSAFFDCDSLTSVTIPDSVTSIGEGAFSHCDSLQTIIIEEDNNNYKSIDGLLLSKDGAILLACPGAKINVTIPDSVRSIGESAFEDCIALTSITIPDRVTSIGEWAFGYCSSLTSVTIPDSVTSIGDWAFDGCSSLTSVTIGKSVTSIGFGAFRGCSSLTSVMIPNSVTSIVDSAFEGCSSLTSVTIPDNVTNIGDSAFYGCSSLTSVTIPDSVTSIGEWAFYGCPIKSATLPGWTCGIDFSEVTNLVISSGTTWIGEGAFYECTSLTSVTIPDSIESIGYMAFNYCDSLQTIIVEENNSNYKSIDGILFSKDGKVLIACPGAKTQVTIPDSVTSIDWYAFSGCSSLTRVSIPLALKEQVEEGNVFEGCSENLEVVWLEPGLEEISSAICFSWGYVVSGLGSLGNEVAIVFTNHTEKAMSWTLPKGIENVQLLVVGGGGGGGADNFVEDACQGGAGGGGGGVITGTIAKLDKESKITITVGGGGAGGIASKTNSGKYGAGTKGVNSIININNTDIVVANGGGCDMGANSAYGYTNGNAGGSGGSGGGGRPNKLGGVANPGTVVENYLLSYQKYGNNGGNGCTVVYDKFGYGAAGGGGGAIAPGGNGTKGDIYRGGNGGEGLASDITGIMTVYGSGGGGSSSWGAAGVGGTGAGNGIYAGKGESGLVNQGGGGGGGSRTFNGGSGGSGIVVLRFVISSDSSLDEVFPEVTDDSNVAATLEGSADVKLVENIKTAAKYAAFREWALNLEGVTPEEVKDSSNAWLSYVLNTDKLIVAAPKEGDIVIDTFEIAATEGAFEFTVKIDGIAVGDSALEANLKKVFDIEGAEKLASGGAGFSLDNVEVNIATPVNGNVKFTVTPKMGNGELGTGNGEKPDSFFFRVKMR